MSNSADGTDGVVLVGARGRLGRFVREVLERAPDLNLVHTLDRGDDLGAGLARRLRQEPASLALDATQAGLGARHGHALLAAGLRPVIATSGVTTEEVAELDRDARERELGGLVVPNFSLGMWLLQELSLQAARHLPAVEIVERHHHKKLDAPSGTALDTQARLQALVGIGQIPIHCVRLPGLFAHQEVQLGGPGETLTLRHDMLGPAAFEPGILAAFEFVRRVRGVGSGIGAAFGAHAQEA